MPVYVVYVIYYYLKKKVDYLKPTQLDLNLIIYQEETSE